MDTIATLGARFLGGALGSLGAAGLRGRGALGGAGVAIAGMAGGADVANGAKALYSGCESSSPVFKLFILGANIFSTFGNQVEYTCVSSSC